MNRHINLWDRRFLKIAEEIKNWSKDPGTKVGSVLVENRRILATGYNGFPQNLSDSLDRYNNREYKLQVTVHSEVNAILNAAKNGTKVEGSTLYVTFPPCTQCASAVIQAGVVKIVCPNPNKAPERWRQNFLAANDLFCEAGVQVLYYSNSDLCQTEIAPCVEPIGSTDNSIGLQENLEKTKTSTPSSVVDLLPKRLKDA